MTEKTVDVALTSESPDFEDSVQFTCGQENEVDFLVTQNIKDYPKKGLTVLLPDVFLQTIPKSPPGKNGGTA